MSLRRVLKRFAAVGRVELLKLHGRYRRAVLTSLRQEPVPDLNASVLTAYARQEKTTTGYTPRKRRRPSYLAVPCFEGRTRDCPEGSLHPGKTHVWRGIRPMVMPALRKLPKSKRLRMRADAAFYDGAFIQWVADRRGQYITLVRITCPVEHRLVGRRHTRIRQDVWAGECVFKLQGRDQARRFVVIRRPAPEEPLPQLHLFQMKGVVYQALATNMTAAPWHLWQFYNDRSQAELIIRELMAASALDKIPMHDFAGNEAFSQLVLSAYNLLNWLKRF